MLHRTTARRALIALLAPTLLLASCRDAGLALGSSPQQARANADALFAALGSRFGPTEPAPGFEDVRTKFARSALVPSRIYNDAMLWTESGPNGRLLELSGRPTPNGYLLGIRGAPTAPRQPGEYRRQARLRNIDRDQYEWQIRDELSVGPISPDDLGAALTALFRAAERTNPATSRAAYHTMLPRTTQALGRLFTLDSLALYPAQGGGTYISLVGTMHPERIADAFPRYSRYLERYVTPASYDLVIHDEDGLRWWTSTKDGDRLTLHLKVHDGNLAPLDAPPRRMPDRLRARLSFSTRIRIFNVGFSDLVGDVTLTREPGEKSFAVRFQREPTWHLPPLVERMIRTPLRRPFDGRGAHMAFSATDAGGRTLLVRDYDLVVQESAILRWFGGLGSTALGDFRGGAEREYDQFNGQVFRALRTDAGQLIR